jgi:hypothetical protein
MTNNNDFELNVDGVSYEAMLENERNEYKLYTLTDSRIVPILRYVPLDREGHLIHNPGKGFYKPVEYEVTLSETGDIEIIGPIRINETRIMVQRYVIKEEMIRILKSLRATASVVVGTLP